MVPATSCLLRNRHTVRDMNGDEAAAHRYASAAKKPAASRPYRAPITELSPSWRGRRPELWGRRSRDVRLR